MIALYSRVSTQEQAASGHSIDEQRIRLDAFCQAHGWPDFRHYTDAGFSGGSQDRPALQTLISDVQAGRVQKVLVYKLDRLSRSQKDTLHLIEDVFLANGADFLSITENFDTASPFGKAMIGLLAVFAQLEREQIKERMTLGRTARAKQGSFHGSGNIPIGYDYDGSLQVNQYEAGLVRQVFEKAAAGLPVRRIVAEMNENGLLHKYGSWNAQTVRKMLQRRTYLGEVCFAGKWYQGTHEAIISEELFEDVQRIRIAAHEKAAQENARLGRASNYLSGLVYCARCGARYTPQKYRHGKYVYDKYSCASRNKRTPELVIDPACKNTAWDRSALDTLVFSQIRLLRLDPAYFPAEPAKTPQNAKYAAIRRIDEQMKRLVDLYALGSVPTEVIREKTAALMKQKEALLQEEPPALTRQQAAEKALTLDHFLDTGSFDEVRALLLLLIDRIEIDGEDVTIRWKFAP